MRVAKQVANQFDYKPDSDICYELSQPAEIMGIFNTPLKLRNSKIIKPAKSMRAKRLNFIFGIYYPINAEQIGFGPLFFLFSLVCF